MKLKSQILKFNNDKDFNFTQWTHNVLYRNVEKLGFPNVTSEYLLFSHTEFSRFNVCL